MLTHESIKQLLTENKDKKRAISEQELKDICAIDYYNLFGLSRRNFDETKLGQAHRALAPLVHPDKVSDPNATELMLHINIARDTLQDSTERQRYDQRLPPLPKERSAFAQAQRESSIPSDEDRCSSPFGRAFTGPISTGPLGGSRNPFETPVDSEEVHLSGERDPSFKVYQRRRFKSGSPVRATTSPEEVVAQVSPPSSFFSPRGAAGLDSPVAGSVSSASSTMTVAEDAGRGWFSRCFGCC